MATDARYTIEIANITPRGTGDGNLAVPHSILKAHGNPSWRSAAMTLSSVTVCRQFAAATPASSDGDVGGKMSATGDR